MTAFDPQSLDTCISCGFCLPSCPTYRLTGDEAASPRGRIALMRAIDTDAVSVSDAVAREQAAFCLGCRACEPACPAGVRYGELLERWRELQWVGRRRPLRVRPLLLFAGSPRLIRAAGRLRRHQRRGAAAGRDDVLMLGCFERSLYPQVSRAAARVLPGMQVPAKQACCGALHAHNGDVARGEALGRRLGETGTRIVSTAGGCAAHLASVIGRDRVLDFSEAVLASDVDLARLTVGGRVPRIGLQDSCHLRNGLGVSSPPRQLLARIGDYVEIPGAGDCCGAAGTYAILRRRDSRRVVAKKLAALRELELDYLAVVNPGCLRQMRSALRREGIATRVVHLAELLARATARNVDKR